MQISVKYVLKSPIDKKISISWDDGLTLNKRQAIVWTNVDIVHIQLLSHRTHKINCYFDNGSPCIYPDSRPRCSGVDLDGIGLALTGRDLLSWYVPIGWHVYRFTIHLTYVFNVICIVILYCFHEAVPHKPFQAGM